MPRKPNSFLSGRLMDAGAYLISKKLRDVIFFLKVGS